MEIVVHLISDLNRYLNLGLYLMVDGRSLILTSLTNGKSLLCLNSSQSLELYKKLDNLKRLITSWSHHVSLEHKNVADKLMHQIYFEYNFDITKHYELKKYGNY